MFAGDGMEMRQVQATTLWQHEKLVDATLVDATRDGTTESQEDACEDETESKHALLSAVDEPVKSQLNNKFLLGDFRGREKGLNVWGGTVDLRTAISEQRW